MDLLKNSPKHDLAALRAKTSGARALASLNALLRPEKKTPLSQVLEALPEGITSADLVLRDGKLALRSSDAADNGLAAQVEVLREVTETLELEEDGLELMPVRADTSIDLSAEDDLREGIYHNCYDSEVVLVSKRGEQLSFSVRGEVTFWVDSRGELRSRDGSSELLCNGVVVLEDPDDEYLWDTLEDEDMDVIPNADVMEALKRALIVLSGEDYDEFNEDLLLALIPALIPTPSPHCYDY